MANLSLPLPVSGPEQPVLRGVQFTTVIDYSACFFPRGLLSSHWFLATGIGLNVVNNVCSLSRELPH